MMILMITINIIIIVHVKDGDKEDKIRYIKTVNLRVVTYLPTTPGRIKLVNNKKGEIVAMSALGMPYS
jgi:hypothetical protein